MLQASFESSTICSVDRGKICSDARIAPVMIPGVAKTIILIKTRMIAIILICTKLKSGQQTGWK